MFQKILVPEAQDFPLLFPPRGTGFRSHLQPTQDSYLFIAILGPFCQALIPLESSTSGPLHNLNYRQCPRNL